MVNEIMEAFVNLGYEECLIGDDIDVKVSIYDKITHKSKTLFLKRRRL